MTDDLVLSDHERDALLVYYTDNCLPEYHADKEEDLWYDIQIGERMFDLNIWLDDITGKLSCTVYECDRTNGNWQTNFKREWVLTVEEDE